MVKIGVATSIVTVKTAAAPSLGILLSRLSHVSTNPGCQKIARKVYEVGDNQLAFQAIDHTIVLNISMEEKFKLAKGNKHSSNLNVLCKYTISVVD